MGYELSKNEGLTLSLSRDVPVIAPSSFCVIPRCVRVRRRALQKTSATVGIAGSFFLPAVRGRTIVSHIFEECFGVHPEA
jgi:hypothetical protein